MNSAAGVVVRRSLPAPAEKVFGAFADAALVAQWLRPSADVKLTVLAFDFRLGGSYRFAYDVPGGQRMVVGGTFSVIERPVRLVFSWLIEPPDEHAGIDSEVSVSLMPYENSTQLTIVHTRLIRADAELRHEQGWRGAVEQLGAMLNQEV
jgi:uncharacterized protein YndB with AHSA1/START domain